MENTTPADEPDLLATLHAAYTSARATLSQLRELLRNRPEKVAQWRRSEIGCPDWCAQGHACTAQPGHMSASPEHRSPAHQLTSPHCTMTATRIQPYDDRRPSLELIVRIPLSRDPRHALIQATWAPVAINVTVGTLLAQIAANFTRVALARAVRQALPSPLRRTR